MIQNAIRTLRTLLPRNGAVSQEEIDIQVDFVLSIPQYSAIERDTLVREIQSIYNIRMDDFRIIESQERRRPWINERRTEIWRQGQTSFWSRYQDYLEIEKNYPADVIYRLHRLTDRTLDSLFDPVPNVRIDKRGLVVGQVQSGKTSNYTGLICKAADAGYKLIIVLAGIHNNLRSQTQLRIDEGFLGFDTQHERAFNQNNHWIGVGQLDQGIVAHSLTSSLEKGDFTSGAANALGINFNTNEPIIAVVKKNASVLNRLLQWLSAQSMTMPDGRRAIRNKSLLMIDDEADNASINTRPENDGTTRINGLIRDILRLFDKSGYVGYTATPFANIFIPLTEQDDLFPRDFIINLPAPSNYIGPEKVFGFEPLEDDDESDSVLPIVRRVDDHQPFLPDALRHRHNFIEFGNEGGVRREIPLPNEVPDSLRLAVKCFIITCAIRRLRGQVNSHNSMLVHVSRLIASQREIRDLVENVFDFYRRGIEMNIPEVINELKQAFDLDTESYRSYISTSEQILNSELANIDPHIQVHEWTTVLPHLNEAAARITVREINGGSADVLNYYDHQNGLSVIAIGGDKLSRGLTLEGLSVSYYLRASKMYDTLMQMGRWFGYRPGYVDLCRLFISRELNEWFCHITLASQQLRHEFDYMADVAGSTPDQYALRVRTHPGVLQISASNKIRRAVEVRVSWSGRLVESYELSKNPDIIQRNLEAATTLIERMAKPNESERIFYLWRDVELFVVKGFLQHFETFDSLKSASPTNLLRFIELNERHNELNNWSIAVISKERATKRTSIGDLNIGLITRSEDREKSNSDLYYIRKSHIISPGDEFIDLTSNEMVQATARTQELWAAAGKEGSPSYPSGEVVRNTIRKPNKPLLLIYFLDPGGANLTPLTPVVGYAISFPANDRDDAVSFAVHEQLLSQFNLQEDVEIIQQDDDED
jgi:hypothetical protein